jgi:UDP-3-O-[3-hydroxymyristoyl] glucosamine N-acyltransferase
MAVELSHSELAALVRGTVVSGNPDGIVRGFASLADAQAGEFSFFGNERYLADLRGTRASAVLVPVGFAERLENVALIAVENPSAAFAAAVPKFLPEPRTFAPGVHPAAVIDPAAQFDRAAVSIGAGAVVEADVVLGDGTEIGAGCYVGRGVRVGRECRLHPRCVVTERCVLGNRVILQPGVVVGGDGFGYEFVDGAHQKVDQLGIVQIDDDVEIGANSTIDRARFGRTWIGEGTKIDNLVQIGHNAVIGRRCIIIAQVGVAGSTQIGDGAILAAQVGVAGHLKIAPGVVVAGQSGVTKSLTTPGQYLGFPAVPATDARKYMVLQRRLPDLFNRLARLEKALAAGRGESASGAQNLAGGDASADPPVGG